MIVVERKMKKGNMMVKLLRAWSDNWFLNKKMIIYKDGKKIAESKWIEQSDHHLREDLRDRAEEILKEYFKDEVENLKRDGWKFTWEKPDSK